MERQTRQRTAIDNALKQAPGPVTPLEILETAMLEVASLNLSTVYRTLGRLVDEGAIVAVRLPGEPVRYEPAEAADVHHHHFQCTQCSTVFDLQGCVDGLKALLPRGFKMSGHDLTLYGTCRACGK